jgi:sigma-70-like protein
MARDEAADAAFTEFATASRARLRSTAYLLCGDWSRASDFVQEGLIRVYVAWPRLVRRGGEQAYGRERVPRRQPQAVEQGASRGWRRPHRRRSRRRRCRGTYAYDLETNHFFRVSEGMSKFAMGGPVPAGEMMWTTPVNDRHGATQWLGQVLR